GAARALRQFVPADDVACGHSFASRQRSPALFRRRRRDVPYPLPDLGFRSRQRIRPVEGDGPAAGRAPARKVRGEALQLRLELAACEGSLRRKLEAHPARDQHFGKLLDYFDRYGLWRDTALILSTDHGFLLAEHDWWGKNLQPYYTEISHIPLIVHHPDCSSQAGASRNALTQTMDLMPTFL